MSISASVHGHGGRRISGWAGLSGTAGSDDPMLPPLPDAPHGRARAGGRHVTGVAVSELVLRDDTGSFSSAGAIITSGGRVRRHAAPLSLRQGVAATRVTTAAVLVGGTALGVVGTVAGPSSPPVDDSPGISPDGTPASVVPIPGAPALPGLPVAANPLSVAFSTSAASLGPPGGALGGALAGTPSPAGTSPVVAASTLPGAPAATVPGPGTGAGGTTTTPGAGSGAGAPVVSTPPQPGTGGAGGGGTRAGGGRTGGGAAPSGPGVAGTLLNDTGSTVTTLVPAAKPVRTVTSTAADFLDRSSKAVTTPVTGAVADVGTATADVPAAGPTLEKTTGTVTGLADSPTGGSSASTSGSSDGSASDDTAKSSSDAGSSKDSSSSDVGSRSSDEGSSKDSGSSDGGSKDLVGAVTDTTSGLLGGGN